MKYNEFKNIVVTSAKSRGLSDYELYYTESEGMSADALLHELNNFSTEGSAGACFRCIYDGKMGYASTELFTDDEAVRIVDAAIENARNIEAKDTVFIHEAGDSYEKTANLITKEPTSAELIDAALKLQEAVYQKDARIIDGSESFAGFEKQTIALCNSKGLDLSYTFDYSQLGLLAVVKEGDEMYNGFEIATDDFSNFDLDKVTEKAVEEAVSLIGNDSVDSGTYDIVLSNKMMATLLSTFFSIFSAEDAQKGLSLLNGKEGETIASELVTLTDDPFCKETYVRMPFDSEGVATHKKNVVSNGKLTTLLHNLTTAHKSGVPSTGNGRKMTYASTVSILPYNFYMEKGGAGTKEDIFKAAGTGIYVTALNGLHAGANPVTGDFSIASEGFLIENGVKSHVVKDFTISGNYYELLKKISMIGDDLDFIPPKGGCCYGAPTVLVKEISVAGK